MKKTGHNSFRTSIQWSRLIPDGVGSLNPEAVAFYNSYIDELLSNDIEPLINLYHFDMPNKKMNPYRGWEIYEKGIYDILTNTRENYGNIKCYISENGMGVEGEERFINKDGQIEDDYRIAFVKDHLRYVHQAIQEGANCIGYHMWTCMDNWSWTNAYKNRYGFIAVNLEQDGQRTIKKSGYWFNEVSEKNGFN